MNFGTMPQEEAEDGQQYYNAHVEIYHHCMGAAQLTAEGELVALGALAQQGCASVGCQLVARRRRRRRHLARLRARLWCGLIFAKAGLLHPSHGSSRRPVSSF
jgi:hypothetical protein